MTVIDEIAVKRRIRKLTTRQTQPVRALVFSGGGAKGGVYPGVFEALVKAKIMDDVENVAGSSAGAITAALIACGITVDDCTKIGEKYSMRDMFGSGVFQKDGQKIIDLVDKETKKSISKFVDSNIDIADLLDCRINNFKTIVSSNNSDAEDKKKAERALDVLTKAKHRDYFDTLQKKLLSNEPSITFSDLEVLHFLSPKIFKNLMVTATNKTTGDLSIFNAQLTPNVPIAIASRASASLPIILSPVMIDRQKYWDGGMADNIPIRPLRLAVGKEVNILSFAFGNTMKDKANIAIYSQTKGSISSILLRNIAIMLLKVLHFLTNSIVKITSKRKNNVISNKAFVIPDVIVNAISKVSMHLWKYIERDNALYRELRGQGINTVVLGTGEVGTLSLDKAQKHARYLRLKGYAQTTRHLCNLGHIPDKKILQYIEFGLGLYESMGSKKFAPERLKILELSEKLRDGELSEKQMVVSIVSVMLKLDKGKELMKRVTYNPLITTSEVQNAIVNCAKSGQRIANPNPTIRSSMRASKQQIRER